MTANTLRVSAVEARRLAITAQRLAGRRPRPTRAGILEVTRDIGYLQLDPTNVVARNPYLVLWSRVGHYEPRLLDDLLEKHREVFETPSLILPVSDLALHGAARRASHAIAGPRRGPSSMDLWVDRADRWLAKNAALRRAVIARLRREGPLPLTAFEDRAIVSWTSGDLHSDKNVSLLLYMLQRRGEVVVAGRRRGQRLWAVADGWLPKVRSLPASTRAREGTLRALRALGLATAKHLRWYYGFNQQITPEAIAALEREGGIVAIEVEGMAGRWYTMPDLGRRLRAVRDGWTGRTTLLSPFDNLIHDRARLEELFGYRYRIEIYTPPRLRRLGYWAMPLLYDDRIIGSVDPRLDRDREELVVNKAVLHPDAPVRAKRAMRDAVEELAAFVGAKKVSWPRRAT